MFVVNDKGSSWAYSTPGFGAPLSLGLLRQLRDMAGVNELAGQNKGHTEVRRGPHGARITPCGVRMHARACGRRACSRVRPMQARKQLQP